jgi:hypothetical protein
MLKTRGQLGLPQPCAEESRKQELAAAAQSGDTGRASVRGFESDLGIERRNDSGASSVVAVAA